MTLDSLSPDYALVASWDTGHTLERILTNRAMARFVKNGVVTETLPAFLIRQNGRPVYYMRTTDTAAISIGGAHTMDGVCRQTDSPPTTEDRAVLFSALCEVLGLRVNGERTVHGSVFDIAMQPILYDLDRFQPLLADEQQTLDPIADRLASAHEYEVAKPSSERKRLAGLRKQYQHTVVQLLHYLTLKHLAMHYLESSPSLWQPTADVFAHVKLSVDGYWICLVLDFLPEPLWSVRLIARTNKWSDQVDFRKPQTLVGESSKGPVSALMAAGLIWPKTEDWVDDWMEQVVADLPGPHMDIDPEAFLLLNTQPPFQWKLSDFIEWLKSSGTPVSVDDGR